MPDHSFIVHKQINIFPKNFTGANFAIINGKMAALDLFVNSQKNILVPLPPDAPGAIPRIILQTAEEDLLVEISLEKISITWKNTSYDENFEVSCEVMNDTMEKILTTISRSLRVKRIGLLKQLIVEADNTLELLKTSNLNRSSKFDSLSDIELKLTFRSPLDSFTNVNELLIAFNGYKRTTTGEKSEIISITSDYNTPQDEENNFCLTELKTFVAQAYIKQGTQFMTGKLFE